MTLVFHGQLHRKIPKGTYGARTPNEKVMRKIRNFSQISRSISELVLWRLSIGSPYALSIGTKVDVLG